MTPPLREAKDGVKQKILYFFISIYIANSKFGFTRMGLKCNQHFAYHSSRWS